MIEIDWPSVRLVVFDVDGTLYRQRPVRLRMAAALIANAMGRRGRTTIKALGLYRRLREEYADREATAFETALRREVAEAHGLSEAELSALVDDWMNLRPLRLLKGARYPAVDRLFDAIRASGRMIGILSDYPAVAKIEAMGLAADHILDAADAAIAVMKPNPAGLLHIIDKAGASPASTLFIGDRVERDGLAGKRAGVRTLIRSSKPREGYATFKDFAEIPLPPRNTTA